MTTSIATALAEGSAAHAAGEIVATLQAGLSGAAPALVVLFASTEQPLSEVLSPVQAAFPGAVVLGASSAGEFIEGKERKGSVSALAVAGDFKVFAGMAHGLAKDVEGAVSQAVAEFPAAVEGYDYRTALLLLDPLSGRGEEATLIASTLLGDNVRLAGGAAGDDLQMTETLVGLGRAARSDAVVTAVIFSKAPLGVGVCHGHAPLSAPLKVTRAEGATVHEVDGRPAWDVWAEHTRAAAATHGVDTDTLTEEELGGFLLRYEAGLSTGADDYKIRAPLSRGPEGELNFACGIPQGSTFQIMESDQDRQIVSARKAAQRALEQTGHHPVAGALVFDCICRNLVLGERFSSAVSEISKSLGGVPLAGFETYGEIALDAGDLSGFHNTTTVVLTFPK